MSVAQAGLRPTAPAERLLQLDVLRGLALFGVLVVNMSVFCGAEAARDAGTPLPLGWGGAWPSKLVEVLIESKAAALLAMLFGAGLAIQWERSADRGLPHVLFALRRVGALALLGLAHSLLLWNVDILLDYAVISLLVLPFVGWSAARVLWAIPILLVVTAALAAPFIGMEPTPSQAAESYAMQLQHYGAGSWSEALRFRVWEFVHVMAPQRVSNRLLILTPFFVLGVHFWKRGWFSDPRAHVAALRRLFWVCFTLGLVANAIPQEALHVAVAGLPRPLRVFIKATCFLARPGLTVGYAAGILLLLSQPAWRAALAVFAPLGRMTLTQYLLQSVICTWIFNGYGLGLFGRLSVNASLLLAAAIFAVQVWSSRWWLARSKTGPVEWLWRRMAYPVTR